MDLQTYRARKNSLEVAPPGRTLCTKCRQPSFGCYCAAVKPFDPGLEFVVLIHPIEQKRRIATGRMSHLCLEGSHLLLGEDYAGDKRVDKLLDDPSRHSVILYPLGDVVDVTPLSPGDRAALFPAEKKLTIFVIDGTWNTARKMVRRSPRLMELPRICFTPSAPSRFRVRKQPRDGFVSTIEAIHETIELLGPARGFDVASRTHDNLLEVFDSMVEKQLESISRHRNVRRVLRKRSA